MSVNVRRKSFEHVEIFGKPALFTNNRIDRDTVPEGWFCYDIRGSDNDPGKLNYLEPKVGVNHAGAIVSPVEVKISKEGYRRIRGQINFLGEAMTLSEFCECHGLERPADNRSFTFRPATTEETRLFYAMGAEKDAEMAVIGHLRVDFGSGSEFWSTWQPRGDEKLNSPAFKAEIDAVVGELREYVLKSLEDMQSYCSNHSGEISGSYRQNYGYVAESENYRYCLRCNPQPGDYQAYLVCFDKRQQELNMAQKPPLVGKIFYANGDVSEHTDSAKFLKEFAEELPYQPTTGFHYELYSTDPQVRKSVDDMLCDLFGEQNPRTLTDYEVVQSEEQTEEIIEAEDGFTMSM